MDTTLPRQMLSLVCVVVLLWAGGWITFDPPPPTHGRPIGDIELPADEVRQ